jgi:hypothetical protein
MGKWRLALAAGLVLIGFPLSAARAQPAADLARMEAEVSRLEAAQAVKRLQRAYGYYVEKGFWREAADLFAKDGTMELGYDGVYVGPERIYKYIAERETFGRDGLGHGQMNIHMQLQGVVSVAPDARSAQGRWHDFTMFGHYGADCFWTDGVLENTYVKENGVWKIKSFRKFNRFMTACDEDWAKIKPAADNWATNGSRRFPHDRGPTSDYKPFPDPFGAPHHYGSPAGRKAEPAIATSDASLRPAALLLTRLKAREAIENLQGQFGYYSENSQWNEAADLFSRDATYEVGQRGVYVGRERIRKALDVLGDGGPKRGKLNNGQIMQPLIHVSADGKRGKARWRGFFQLAEPGGKGRWLDGVYENEYVLEDGLWKISKLHFYQVFEAGYEGGWEKDPIKMAGPSRELPPDRPPSVVYGSFPDVFIPPYHYMISNGTDASRPLPPAAKGPAQARVAALSRRIERLSDLAQIENLQRQYGYYVDKHMWSALPEIFTDNATLEIGGRGVFVGKERIHEYMKFLGAEGVTPGQVFNHTQLVPIVTVAPDGRTAKARWTAFIMVGVHKELSRWGYVTYENDYVKTSDGWKIKTLYAYFNFYSDYSGWGKNAQPNTKPEARLPPDRPPTVVYEMYPEIGMAPFHYAHPVTGKPTGPIKVWRREPRPEGGPPRAAPAPRGGR